MYISIFSNISKTANHTMWNLHRKGEQRFTQVGFFKKNPIERSAATTAAAAADVEMISLP